MFKLEISRCQIDGAWELGYEGNGLFLFSSKHKLDGSSSVQLPEFTREAFQVMALSCPEQ